MKGIIIGEGGSFDRIRCPKCNITTIEIDVELHDAENVKYILQQFNMDVLGLGLNNIKRGDECSLTLE